MNSTHLVEALKTLDFAEILTIQMSHPHSDVVKMTFQNEKTGKSRKVCTKLREYEETDLTPQGEFSSIVILDSKVFQRELSHFNQCKKVRIRTTLSGISLFGENDSQSFEVIFPPNDGNLNNSVSIQLIEEVDAEFSVKYLEYFTKISGISDSVELKISNDLLCVEYGLGEEGYLRYYLAARIEEDEDMD